MKCTHKESVAKKILGTWKLVNFIVTGKDGTERPWGLDTKGILIYAPDNFMSVSLTRATCNDDTDPLAPLLFYAGRYQVFEDRIEHCVEIASDKNRVGQRLIRTFQWENGRLILCAKDLPFGKATLCWQKV